MNLTSSEAENLLELYQQDINCKIIAVAEIMRRKEKWKKENIATLPTNAIDALEACNAGLSPNVRKLLAIWQLL